MCFLSLPFMVAEPVIEERCSPKAGASEERLKCTMKQFPVLTTLSYMYLHSVFMCTLGFHNSSFCKLKLLAS